MAVRRLSPDQPHSFTFSAENLAWAKATIEKYPKGKEASAIIPLLWRAQEQCGGWLPEPALRVVADMLGMAYIRAYEVATFYTMFQLSPVGKKAHVQVCGTTPCMLRGAGDSYKCARIGSPSTPMSCRRTATSRGKRSNASAVCANAPVVQVFKDTYEDLTAATFEKVLDGFARGTPPKVGSQSGRKTSVPEGGPTTLTDPSLYDGSSIGAWKKRFPELQEAGAGAPESASGDKPKG